MGLETWLRDDSAQRYGGRDNTTRVDEMYRGD